MSLALAFEGCSCRAAFQVGAARRLLDAGVEVDVVGGASSGSMVAAAVALDRLDDLEDRWTSLLGTTHVFQPRRLLRLRWPMAMSHILRDALHEHLGDVRMSEVPVPLVVVVTQIGLRGRRRRVIDTQDDLRVTTAIRASSFIPGPYSRMVPIDRRPTFDGAWQARAPLEELAQRADRVIAVLTEDQGRHLAGFFRVREAPVPTGTRVLAPLEPLPLRGFDFDEERTRACFAIGRRSGEHFLRANETWLAEI